MSVGQMSVSQMSVGQMSVGQMSVGQTVVGQMFVDEKRRRVIIFTRFFLINKKTGSGFSVSSSSSHVIHSFSAEADLINYQPFVI